MAASSSSAASSSAAGQFGTSAVVEGSRSLQPSSSTASLSGASGDADVDGPQELAMQALTVVGPNAAAANPVYGVGGRLVANPHLQRSDVGTFGLLSGNWGEMRANVNLQEQINENLRKSPASIICLQEANPEIAKVLATTAVAGDAESEDPLQRRSAYEYHSVVGNETCKTNLIAGRTGLVERMAALFWLKRNDGSYRDNKTKKLRNAYTRVLVVSVKFKEPRHNMTATVVANVHLHHNTAKKAKGFSQSWTTFWIELADLIRKYSVRILTGDWNMSLFQVVPCLRQQGINLDVAALYGYAEGAQQLKLDSCGVFIVGAGIVSPCLDLRFFHSHGRGALNEEEEEVAAAAPGLAYIRGGAVHTFVKGQGHPLDCYLPKNGQMEAVAATLTRNAPASVEAFTPYIPCRQKLVIN